MLNRIKLYFKKRKLLKITKNKLKQLEKQKIEAIKLDIIDNKEEILNSVNEIKHYKTYAKWRETINLNKKNLALVTKLTMPKNKILAFMFLRDGTSLMFFANTEKNFFEFEKNNYLIDVTKTIFLKNYDVYMSFYDQSIAIPLDVVLGLKTLLKNISLKNVQTEVNLGIDSKVFERFLKSEFVQKLMSGADLLGELNFLKFAVIILLILDVIYFVFFIILMFK